MKFKLWREYGALNSKPVFDAFETSLRNAGFKIVDNNQDVDVIWSVLFYGRMASNRTVWDNAQKNNKKVIVLEVGGIKRGETWKVGLNGINNGAFTLSGNDSTRADNLGLKLKPWRTDGEFILICGQHDKSLQWQNIGSMSNYFIKTIDTIQSLTDRPILIRPHPRCRVESIEKQYKNVYRQDPIHIQGTYDSYDLAFERIWATISYNSNPGPQSAIAGVPVFTSPSSLAWPVSNINFETINNPIMPDRQQWLHDYAWTEYTLDEIAHGIPLNSLTHRL